MLLYERSSLISLVNEFDIICFGIESNLLALSCICFRDVGKEGSGCCCSCVFLRSFLAIPRLFFPADKVCKFLSLVIGWSMCRQLFSTLSDLRFVSVLFQSKANNY